MDHQAKELFERLTAQREAALAQAQSLGADLRGIIAAAADVATDDEHDPEGTTIAYERAHVGSLLSDTEARIRDLDSALARLATGDYGHCTSCGRLIDPERLIARPAARTCITCAAGPH